MDRTVDEEESLPGGFSAKSSAKPWQATHSKRPKASHAGAFPVAVGWQVEHQTCLLSIWVVLLRHFKLEGVLAWDQMRFVLDCQTPDLLPLLMEMGAGHHIQCRVYYEAEALGH